jgi:hypothetical protein
MFISLTILITADIVPTLRALLKNTNDEKFGAMCSLLRSMTEVLKELVTSKPSTNLNKIIDTVHNESVIALRA